MKIGMNLVLWTLAVKPEHFALLRWLRELGYEGVEVPITQGNGEDFDELRRVLDGEGLACTTLTNLRPDANPVSTEPGARQKALDGLRWATDVSHVLGSTILSGPFYAASDVFTGHGPTQDELDRSASVLREACAYAAGSGTTLSIEYLSRFEIYLLNTARDAARYADLVGAGNIGLTYDTHHAHLEEDDIHRALTEAGPRIKHVHFSESHRGTLGGGVLDWTGTVGALKAIGYDGWLMVEAFSTQVTELARKAKVWRDTFTSREQVARDGIAFARAIWNGDGARPRSV